MANLKNLLHLKICLSIFLLSSCVSVPINNKTSVTLLDKNESLYIEEDKSLTLVASTGNVLKAFISYEEII